MTTVHPSSRLPYVAALDGWRGVAVLAVLLFHAEVSWMPGGFLGVSAFFTLSGFLITSLLLRERVDGGRIDLGAFWARRARRLLPASFLALALVVAYGAFAADPSQVRTLGGDVLAAMLNVANWRFIVEGRSYERLFTAPSPVQHFWSLSIEEQGYLLLPVVAAAALATRRPRATLFGVLAALTVASITIGALLADPTDNARTYYGTDTRLAELLIGALAAIAVTSARGARTLASGGAARAIGIAGVAATVPLAVWWATVDQSDAWLARGGLALHAVLVAVVLVAATRTTLVARMLAVRPLVGLGAISYGVYLFHWPIFLWLDGDRTGFADGPLLALRVAITIALAALSYRFVEQPIRHGAALTTAHARIALPVAALVVLAGLLVVSTDAPEPAYVLEPVSATGPPQTIVEEADADALDRSNEVAARVRDTSRPSRVLVVGDSVALTLGRGMERWGANTEDAVVWNAARKWCSIGRFLERPAILGGAQGAPCDDWPARWGRQVDEFDPDVVVVLSTIWELIDRRANDWDGWRSPGDPAYDAWQVGEYAAAVDTLAARGARVVWLTVPCVRDAIDAATPGRIGRYNAVQLHRRLVAERPGAVRVVDLHRHVCPDGAFADRIAGVSDARPDGNHFSDAGADAVASWLMPRLLR